jgi:two-component system response regulator VicR
MKKILLAENDVFLTSIYINELRKSGYSTAVALDSQTAINSIKNASPDLLILDDNIPKIDSFSVLKSIREDMGDKKLKVVMLLNFDQKEKINDNLEFGVIKHFIKSENTAEEIVDEIKRILN